MDPRQLEERIARAKEAARLASIAATTRPGPPPPRPPPPHGPRPVGSTPFGFVPPPMAHPPAPVAFSPGYAAPSPSSAPPPPPYAPNAIPEDVRRRIEHLVEFIRRNGPAFEETVKQRERENPSFAFLHPGAPFNDYYQWRKWQSCGPAAPPNAFPAPAGPRPITPPPMMPRGPVMHAPVPVAAAAPVVSSGTDSMSSLAVGAMANVCRLAKASGLPPYAPIPHEIVANVAALPPVEPGRLEIRLADFYRASHSD